MGELGFFSRAYAWSGEIGHGRGGGCRLTQQLSGTPEIWIQMFSC